MMSARATHRGIGSIAHSSADVDRGVVSARYRRAEMFARSIAGDRDLSPELVCRDGVRV